MYYIEIYGNNLFDTYKIEIKETDIPNFEYIKTNIPGCYESYSFSIFKAYCETRFYRSATLRKIENGFDGLVCEWFRDASKNPYFFYDNHQTCKEFLNQYKPAEYIK